MRATTQGDGVLPFARPGGATIPDEEQVATIVLQMHAELVCWATSLIGVDEAEDAVQDALLRYWRRRKHTPADRLPPDVRSHLLALVRDIVRERQRSTKRRGRTLSRIGGGVTAHRATHISSPFISGVRRWMWPEQRIERSEFDPRIEQALESLTATQRELITLVYAHGLTQGEAGAVLNLAASSVRAHLARAHARMRESLKSLGLVRGGAQVVPPIAASVATPVAGEG